MDAVMDGSNLYTYMFWLLFAYLLGSCPTGYILVKALRGEDIRKAGSGNIGATNVGRVLGKKWSVITACFDMFKGGIALVIAILSGVHDDQLLALMGLASVLGHDYPLWLRFKGGKGVATTFGVIGFFGFFNPIPALIGGFAWFAIRELTRYVSIASMLSLATAALVMPIFDFERPYFVVASLLFFLTVWRHRENIARLFAGKENKATRLFIK